MANVVKAGHFKIKTGDTVPLVATLRTKSGLVDLEGATVRLLVKPIISGVGPTIAGTCTVLQSGDTDVGKVQYEWEAGETSEAGLCRAEFEVTFADTTVETFPDGTASDDYLTVEFVAGLG